MFLFRWDLEETYGFVLCEILFLKLHSFVSEKTSFLLRWDLEVNYVFILINLLF